MSSRIFCIVGKSGSGKDTIYHRIVSEDRKGLVPVIPYTTRPKRIDEQNGVNYFFVEEEEWKEYERQGQVIEQRRYHTTQGIWTYFTLRFDCKEGTDHILITTLEGVRGILRHYPAEMVHIVYLDIDDKSRLLRCIDRESQQQHPDYQEVCRRYLADHEDFSAEQLESFGNLHYIDSSTSVEDTLKAWWSLYESSS